MKKNSYTETALYIFFGIIIALGVNYGLALTLSTDMPIVAVQSYSMVPEFYKGDILILQGIPTSDLKIGDIIVFSVNGQPAPIVHRIVAINNDGTFQTKGDANSGQLNFEKKIAPEQIHGKEVLIIPFVGWVKIGVMEFILPNINIFAALIILIIIIYYGISYLRRR